MLAKPKNFLLLFILLLGSLFTHAKVINYTSEVTVTGNMSRLMIWMPVPITNEYQTISDVSTSFGFVYEANNDNKIYIYDNSFLSGSSFSANVTCKYETRPVHIDFNGGGNKNLVTSTDPYAYLGSEGTLIDLSNPSIIHWGDSLWAVADGDSLQYAKLCYEFVAKTFTYVIGGWRSLEQILLDGGGECGDFSTIFVNLVRYKGIPARHLIGQWYDHVQYGYYHVMADFYLDAYGWIPVDAQGKNANPWWDYFGQYYGDLVITTLGLTSYSYAGRNIKSTPLQNYWWWYYYGTNVQDNFTTYYSDVTELPSIVSTPYDENASWYDLNGRKTTSSKNQILITKDVKVMIR